MEAEFFELAERLGQALKSGGKMLATAESCTGGWVAQTITDVPGSSAWFDRGFVTYSNAAKVEMLGVSPKTLEQHGAVSAETAAEMAAGALARSNADIAVAVTGIAGPDGGTPEKPVGLVFIAWAGKDRAVSVEKKQFSGNRREVRMQTVRAALEGIIVS
ncbi:MAG: CinA family protein [Methylobacter sp.]